MSTVFASVIASDPKLAEACARVRAGGLRVTNARIALLQILISHPVPCSIDALHSYIGRTCDLVTAHRNINGLLEIGLVRRIFGLSGIALYELALDPQRYFVMAKSGATPDPIPGQPSPEMRLAMQRIEDELRALGYTQLSHTVQFFADPPVSAVT